MHDGQRDVPRRIRKYNAPRERFFLHAYLFLVIISSEGKKFISSILRERYIGEIT